MNENLKRKKTYYIGLPYLLFNSADFYFSESKFFKNFSRKKNCALIKKGYYRFNLNCLHVFFLSSDVFRCLRFRVHQRMHRLWPVEDRPVPRLVGGPAKWTCSKSCWQLELQSDCWKDVDVTRWWVWWRHIFPFFRDLNFFSWNLTFLGKTCIIWNWRAWHVLVMLLCCLTKCFLVVFFYQKFKIFMIIQLYDFPYLNFKGFLETHEIIPHRALLRITVASL